MRSGSTSTRISRTRDKVTAQIKAILSKKNYFENLETVIRTRSGETRSILWNTKKITDQGQQRTITIGLDITEQRRADRFQESVIDNANILIAVLERGNVRIWNHAAETITGYSPAEVIGKRDVWHRSLPGCRVPPDHHPPDYGYHYEKPLLRKP